jgi:phospholipase C
MMKRVNRRRFLQLSAASAAVAACGPRPPPRAPEVMRLGGKVQHFVVLMMENRSYDQMLGALPGERYAGAPAGTKLAYRDATGAPREVTLRYGTPHDMFYPDPPHRFAKVMRQIYGAGPDAAADMGGFAQVFSEEAPLAKELALGMEDYATFYADGKLPILQTLAKEYGVCTHWFASAPSATTPNRMFAHAGTSGGANTQGAFFTRLRGKTIFDELGKDKSLWRVYYHDAPHLWITGDVWMRAFAGQMSRISRFERDVKNDELPVYSFIEPRHIVPPWTASTRSWA